MKLKLFVWDNVLTDYSEGIIFAYASDIDQAKALVLLASGDSDYIKKCY